MIPLVALALLAAPRADAAALVDCPFNDGGGDLLDRGFYITGYTGATLKSVRVAHRTTLPATNYTIQMTARLGSYGGVLLGTASVTREIDGNWSISYFDFGDVAVAPGSTITFAQDVTAGDDASIFYNVGEEPCSATQTNGTAPPLDSVRRGSVGVVVDGSPQSPGQTLLLSCPFEPDDGGDNLTRGFYIDDYPGTTLDTITLRFNGSGVTEIELQARLERYDGFILGTVNLAPNLTTSGEVTFPFNVAVPAGARIVFLPRQVSGTTAFLQTGYGLFSSDPTVCPRVTETSGQEAPLSSFRRPSIAMKVVGRTASDDPIPAVEYFHGGFGHYFMTAQADEIAGLDGGAFGGVFSRTGREFDVYDGPVAGAIPVCRFFTVAFAPKSSHFYTSDPVECAGVKLNPNWQYEKIAFYVRFHEPACPAGHVPVYRLYNNGMTGAPNHRYTTDLALYNQFVNTMGWAPEGVRFCVPS
jgi:hypothetical protein